MGRTLTERSTSPLLPFAGVAVAVALLAIATAPAGARLQARREARRRLALTAASADIAMCARGAGELARGDRSATWLASWQTVGGCGAGASSGTGAGVKWIGRNVTGGLFHVECQGNYVHTVDGYNYVATTMVTRDVNQQLNVGVVVPYVYKYYGNNPYGRDFNVINKGLGDVNLLVTGRFGAINDNIVTLSVGAPSGTYDAHLPSYQTVVLPQDQQLGAGKVTGSLMYDHLVDNIWGPTVFGVLANWRGGENRLQNYRSPSFSGYWYSSYLVGPFAPAVGLSVTRFLDHDRDQEKGEQGTPLWSMALNASLEWSTPSVAVLVGAALPYQYNAITTKNEQPVSPWGWGAWIVGVGLALSPF